MNEENEERKQGQEQQMMEWATMKILNSKTKRNKTEQRK